MNILIPSTLSLWSATSTSSQAFPVFEGEHTIDLVVVGGGFAGLSTALHAARKGMSCMLLEAHEVGFGGSGRSGGLVSGKFRVSFQAVMAQHGREAALQLHAFGKKAVDCVEQLISEHNMTDACYSRSGYITAAHSSAAMKGLQTAVNWLEIEALDHSSRLIDAEETAAALGTRSYLGGAFNTYAGHLHPLNYLRGLARAATVAGAQIFEHTPVRSIEENGGWVTVVTDQGRIIAKQVLISTDAYSNLTSATKRLARSIVPFRSSIIATVPLNNNVASTILPRGVVAADTKRLLRWYRKVDNRLIFGGRGAFDKDNSPAAFSRLYRQMQDIFPQVEGQRIEYSWSGLVAMTLDYLPHIVRQSDRVMIAAGFNGSGVAAATYAGACVADLLTGVQPQIGILQSLAFNPIPARSLIDPGVRMLTAYYQFLDSWNL
jgi:glycine/D-amino acid oxidase-like deaminating enzyme